MTKRLYKSRKNTILEGVCAGLAEYFNMDPSIMRILFVVLAIPLNLLMVVVYIALAIIVPRQPMDQIDIMDESFKPVREQPNYHVLVGGVLILIGGYAFLNRYVDWFDLDFIAPVVLVLLGVYLIFTSQKKKEGQDE